MALLIPMVILTQYITVTRPELAKLQTSLKFQNDVISSIK